MLLFLFTSRYFLIYPVISSLNHWLVNFHIFVNFPVFFLLLTSNFSLWLEWITLSDIEMEF